MRLSIKKAWFSIVLVIIVIPVVLLLSLGGTSFYKQLLAVELNHAKNRVDTIHALSRFEFNRIISLLENKSDPMAYTLGNSFDKQLLNVLLQKVLSREPEVRLLAILNLDGSLITGLTQHQSHQGQDSKDESTTFETHWSSLNRHETALSAQVLNGEIFIGSGDFHDDAVLLTIAVPIGPKNNPIAILWAEIDVSLFWMSVQQQLPGYTANSYLVDTEGRLLVTPEKSRYQIDHTIVEIPVVQAYVSDQAWPFEQAYSGISGELSYGTYKAINNLPWAVISETTQEQILAPIKQFFIKLLITIAILILILLVIGLLMAKRIITPINILMADFRRVSKLDYQASEVVSPFIEIETLVDRFNKMVHQIRNNQEKLHHAAIVFESTSEGVMITDKDLGILSVNKAFTEITGYTNSEAIGERPSLLSSGRHDHEFFEQMWQDIKKFGQWTGEIWNRRKNGEIYPQLLSINTATDRLGNVTHYIGVFSDISSIKETEEKLDRLAHTDVLTGLPNRLLCHARMEQVMQYAIRNNERAALLFLDLDNFKNVNDSLGHIRGDNLLKLVARRLNEKIRDEDILSRLGGDEFVVILSSLNESTDVSRVAEQILGLLTMPFIIDNHEVFISGSIGISIFPDDGEDYETLLRNADAAMYKAKSDGRNNYQYYTSQLTDQAYTRLNMETRLRHALERDELFLDYQPQFSIENHELIGAEVLIRWQDPEMGLVSPDNFIPVAEDTGLIVPIGLWVIETACKQLLQWQQQGLDIDKLAINLSAIQFTRPGLVHQISEILDKTGISPQQLDLEITESILILDSNITINTLKKFSEMGMELSIDDFGTGYSSLSYIKRFPINRLKIDRSFVSDIMSNEYDAEMIISIIALGHSMGLKVLAEGVETEEQLAYLVDKGCDEAQGYIYSKPLPPDEFEAFLNSANLKKVI